MRQRHPAGLYVLFFTEMWERFGFYCMESVFVYYMEASQYSFLRTNSSRIYGLYLAGVYFTPFFGGLLAEWKFGYYASIILGGAFMAGGYGFLSLEPAVCFAIGLGLIILGNGLFKPNISSLVGKLYPQGDPRIDSAFTLFYMGINIGALFSPIVAGIVGNLFVQANEQAMAAATSSLVAASASGPFGSSIAGSAALMGTKELAHRNGYLTVFLIAAVGMVIGEIIFLLFRRLVVPMQATTTTPATVPQAEVPADLQRRRNIALLIFFGINVLFWMAFKQRANSMALWTKDRMDLSAPTWLVDALSTLRMDWLMLNNKGEFGKEFFLALNPMLVIILSPLLVWLWSALRSAKLEVPTPAKLVLGFVLTAAAFAIMWRDDAATPSGSRASVQVLLWFYLALTAGELCLSPMGLSLVSKLAPSGSRAVWMGLFFISTSMGGYLAGEIFQIYKSTLPPGSSIPYETFFFWVSMALVGGTILMLGAYPLIARALKPAKKAE